MDTKPIEIKGKLLQLTDGWAVMEVSREEFAKRKETPEFAYVLESTRRVKTAVGVEKYEVVVETIGYLVDGSEKIILHTLLDKRTEPFKGE